ncbi:MAG: alpha/beta hydrolase [Verrucomicrobiales bacterium]|nr:alpha/beta hydrolase [Verrucomicrobiales bacterium]
MRWLIRSLGFLLFGAANAGEVRDPVPLWPGGAPGARGTAPQDVPTLTAYLPERPNGSAMVICPGGAYAGLAGHEGNDYALFLNRYGIACFVLKYRLGSHGYRHPAMLQDAARAVRTVRHGAAGGSLDPHRIGIMGSSAGGHLASTLLTHFDEGDPRAADPVDRESSRPDLGILCYPVVTLGPLSHAGSRMNLLGPDPSPEWIEALSNERQVTPRTPPTFLWHTVEDAAVPVENSMEFAGALRRNRVPFELHIYEAGRHGLGLAAKPPEFAGVHPWSQDLIHWLQVRKFIP